MATLPTPQTSTKQLWYERSEGRFIGEISCTHGFGRAYDDACDEGMTLVNPDTGREARFVVDRTEVRDGEIVAWHLVLLPGQRVLQGLTITLFND